MSNDGIAKQNAEFDALNELTRQWRRLQMTPVVDDDYPAVRHDYESALRSFITAYEKNRDLKCVTVGFAAKLNSADLTFAATREANVSRCNQWHGLQSWGVMEWACAMAGEAGEACNVAKKIKRIETGIAKRAEELIEGNSKKQVEKLAEECADTFIYLDLLCASRGIDLAAAVRKKFNSVSVEYNFPQRV